MYLLLSGEGAGDIGACYPALPSCKRDGFSEGPMAIIIDQLVEFFQEFEMSHLDTERISFVSEGYLADNKVAPNRKKMSLKGKKKPEETKYYYENARALARVAKIKSEEVNDQVVAILFRDADGTASAGRGNWLNKRQSMCEGFIIEGYGFGVPMIPQPKSEAWLLCAVKQVSYQDCNVLESESGNDSVDNSLKSQLAEALHGQSSRDEINQLLKNRDIDVLQINMNSFNCFKDDLRRVVRSINGFHNE